MTAGLSRLRLLFVEDAPDLRRAYRRFFEDRFELEFAATGAEAVAAVAAFTPDVVVLDMQLPDTDGIEVLRELRERLPGVRVVITTAYASMEPLVEVLGLPYSRYLLKPYDLNELEAAIVQAAGRAP